MMLKKTAVQAAVFGAGQMMEEKVAAICNFFKKMNFCFSSSGAQQRDHDSKLKMGTKEILL